MRILSLGAGVQSTAIFLLAREGKIAPIEHAIFGDTQEEPKAVYAHLEWMKSLDGTCVIHVATAGKLGDDLLKETCPSIPHADGAPYKENHRHRFASIPAFTGTHHEKRTERDPCNEGIIRRQCTKEYKIEVVEKVIRRVVLGLKFRQRMPKDFACDHIFGISCDEKGRAERIAKNWQNRKWATPVFPLIEMGWTRTDCIEYLKGQVPHEVSRSACVFCPFKSASEWLVTKSRPDEWNRAVEIDNGLRTPGKAVNARMDQAIYLHRSLIPLEMIDFPAEAKKEQDRREAKLAKAKTKEDRDRAQRTLFDVVECEGMCGM